MLWVPITLAAAFLQNLRSALQKKLTADLSTGGAAFSRFAFAAPVAILYALTITALAGTPLTMPGGPFWVYAAIGGLAQILGTVFLLKSFSHGSFALGTAFSKTESLQAAVFGLLMLGEAVGALGGAGLVIGFFGVLVLISNSGAVSGWSAPKSALLGVLSGAGFAVAAVCYRAAALSLDAGSAFERAGITLAAVTTLQTLAMAFWLQWREPGEVARVFRAWRLTGPTALAGVAASGCWFTAVTLQQVAYVRALGQVELAFSTLSSALFFKERVSAREIVGIALIGVSIVLVLLAAARA